MNANHGVPLQTALANPLPHLVVRVFSVCRTATATSLDDFPSVYHFLSLVALLLSLFRRLSIYQSIYL